ncbi:apoptosis regulator Bcl-2-like [Centroberyx gerrardi]
MAAYDSRDIVENFLRHKLRRRGVAWRFQPTDNLPSPSASSSSSSSSRTLRRGVAPSSSREEADPRQASRPPSGAPPGVRLQAVLRRAGEELERRCRGRFSGQMSALLERSDRGAARRGLAAVREELFGDGVNWGRLVALLELGGALCVEAAQRERAGQVDDIAAWLVESLEAPPLRGWIEDNGGWDAFVELYGQPGPPVSYWSLKTVFGLAVLGAAGITLGVLFTQK